MAAAKDESKGHGRVQMTARDVSDGVCHGHDGQAEGEGYTHQAYTDVRKRRGEHRTPTAPEHQPKSPNELCRKFPGQGHNRLLSLIRVFRVGRLEKTALPENSRKTSCVKPKRRSPALTRYNRAHSVCAVRRARACRMTRACPRRRDA